MTDDPSDHSPIEMLRALGEPTRIRIVDEIAAGGPLGVAVLAGRLGLPYMAVWHNLSSLRRARVLAVRRCGQFIEYSFAPGVFTPSADGGELGTLNVGAWRISIGRTAEK
ncbi:helix-turn-helix domain-containing protein [Limnoglobus roseus]|uniref:ArsR family transcriptional regulator n=1 Tax=Limnoglobus roseus TaxID=2598579 RepID=A0A5C1AKB5_9BACT|nr:helix-turn-helix transcriptional regulator [Limnoglobus roseus]QEL17594.1 ArsR family transcriptional regulator [Limnoglobus roseus]